MNCSERKKPPSISTAIITQNGVESRKIAHSEIDKPPRTAFQISTLRKPKRLSMRGAAAFMNSAPMVEVNVISPDLNGVRWKPTWSSSGNRNGMAPTPMRNMKPPTRLARKVCSLSRLKSRMGAGARRA